METPRDLSLEEINQRNRAVAESVGHRREQKVKTEMKPKKNKKH